MKINHVPMPDLKGDISETKLNTFGNPMRMKSLDTSPEIPEFKTIMSGMVRELDSSMKAPDQVLQASLTNNGC
ncbi:MAG: hypothetical protein MZU97_09205 [Bacillus subtilis]|nr:hypothetical protein [Bacillus subtilis]